MLCQACFESVLDNPGTLKSLSRPPQTTKKDLTNLVRYYQDEVARIKGRSLADQPLNLK